MIKSIFKGYKFRIYPTDEQKEFFAKTFGCCRFVWNYTLDGKTMPSYYPLMIDREIPIKQGGTKTASAIPVVNNAETHTKKIYDKKYPVTRLDFPKDLGNTVHPTQKPKDLCKYLIKTYTLENDLVLDNCAGSGTTGLAARNLNRNYILIEKEQKYYDIILERLK